MRLAKLELIAYGPFRSTALDFSRPGIHIVYGRNEAGKSTTLRAITGLLYGIDSKTPDAHVHKFADLRIGGVLENAAGERVRVVRRKGLSNTLLDGDERPLDESVMRRFLGGVTRETFLHAFGLDHETLEAGARSLLEGKGDLGESLFDAGVGGGGEVQRLVAELAAEADRLYKPRASSLPLNDALKAFESAQKAVRERQSLPEAFLTQEAGLASATAERDARKKARLELEAERERHERIKERVPLERRRVRALAARETLGAAGGQSARIRGLRDRFSAYERAVDARRGGLAEVERTGDRVAEAARRAGLAPGTNAANAEGLRLDARREARIQKLLEERTKLALQLDAARKSDARAERELARQIEGDEGRSPATGALADEGALSAALEAARALGDVDARVEQTRTRAERKRADLEAKAASLGGAPDLDAFVALRVPALATVEKLEARAEGFERTMARLDERASDLEREEASLERQIAAQSGDFAPPDAAELRAARAARDEAWKTSRATEEPQRRRAAELEVDRLLRDVDGLADRMIREADRVTMLARLRSEIDSRVRQRARLAEEKLAAEKGRAAVVAELAAAFTGPTSGFAETKRWLVEHARIVEASVGVRDALRDVADEEERAGRARSELATALRKEGRLTELVSTASAALADLAGSRRASAEAAKTIAKLRGDREELAAALAEGGRALADVESKLGELLGPLGVPADASAEEINRSIEAGRDLFQLIDKRADVEARAKQADAEARAFEEELARATEELAPDLSTTDVRAAALSLFERGVRAEEVSRELAEVEAQLETTPDVGPTDAERELALDPERSAAYARDLAERREEVERDISRLEQTIGGLKTGLEQMRVESNAAEAAALAQTELARVRENAERWCRVKLATFILAREIDRYREENQAPLLAATSSLFSRLTLGAYAGVKAGFDDKDKPCLRCIRGGGAEVEVDVAGLSDGTRDQLYLSLRLASLLRRVEVADPMPLVLDDVLIQLDDARAGAALGMLAEVSRKIQILFFTHHARLVDLARASVTDGELVVHELGGTPVTAEYTAPA